MLMENIVPMKKMKRIWNLSVVGDESKPSDQYAINVGRTFNQNYIADIRIRLSISEL